MNPSIEKIKTYLNNHPPDYGEPDIHSLLEMLWMDFSEYNPVMNETMKAYYGRIEQAIEVLSQKEQNDLFDTVSELCMENEHLAYIEGIKLGARLILELTTE